MANPEERIMALEEDFRLLRAKVTEIEKGKFEKLSVGSGGIAVSDAKGTSRVTLALRKADGEPCLFFSDSSGKPRVIIGGDEIRVTASGGESIRMAIGESGPMVVVGDQDDNPRASMGLVNGGACIILFDRTRGRIHLRVDEGQASIVLNDADEKPRIGIAIEKDGSGSLAVLDCEGHLVQGLGEE